MIYLLRLLPFDANLDCGAGFNELIVPRTAEWLAKFKSGGTDPRNGANADEVINFYRSQVGTTLLFELVTVLMAPMLAVFLFDESCLRYYLVFAQDLERLMNQWGIGMRGTEAYRNQFCSRQLVMQFSYVWISMTLLYGFLNPAIALIKSNFLLRQAQTKREEQLQERGAESEHDAQGGTVVMCDPQPAQLRSTPNPQP